MAAGSSRGGGAGGVVPHYEDEASATHTQVFHAASFGAAWREALGPQDLSLQEAAPGDEEAAVAEEFRCPLDVASQLRAVCSVTPLKMPATAAGETSGKKRPRPRLRSPDNLQEPIHIDALKSPDKEDTEEIPEDSNLVTLIIRKKALERREETLVIDRAGRLETFSHEMESHAIGKRPEDPVNLVKEGELVLTLNIFYPVIFQKHKTRKPYQTMLVLGSQKLTEVRDSISCVSDLQIGGEFSSHPDLAPEHISKDLYKSAFFYFEGIFYNDMRYPECRDLSRTITEWAESRERSYTNLQAANMEDYTFNNLNIKVGFPYLYCHQGECEHIVIITDIRLIHQDDCLDRSLYPLLTKKHWLWTKKCFVCKMYTARWVTNNDSLAPQDPSFFCDTCFQMLHYDADGNKLGQFLAYPYVDPGIFN